MLLVNAGLSVTLYKRYVDDSNIFCPPVSTDLEWDSKNRLLVKRDSSFDESTSPDQWTAEVLRNVAESVSPMLKWTADSPSSHDTGKMPVLDICLWTEETDSGTSFQYEFYSKPMANPVTVPANSAISHGVKLATYRQEVVRVLSNTSYSLPCAWKAELLSDMAWRIQKAGYGIGFIVTVLNGGIRAHAFLIIR